MAASGSFKDVGTSATISRVMSRWHEIILGPKIPVREALIWTMYIAANDKDGESWTRTNIELLRDKMHLQEQMTEAEFQYWVTGGSEQLRRKLQNLGTDYLQLIPLANWLVPGDNESYFWKWQPALYIRDLSIEGRKAITSGLVGSGKTMWSVYCAEQLARLKDGLRDEGPASVFAQIRRSTARTRYAKNPEEAEESQLPAGEPIKQLGLYHATDIGFVANFSIRDRVKGIPSPIRDRWRVAVTFSGILRRIGENLLAGKFTHVPIDEAGTSIDRNLSTSYQMRTWRDFFRLARKLNASAHLLTQHEKTDFPDDVLDDATCFTRLIAREDNRGPKGGFFSVPSFLNDEYMTDIPRAVTDYATDKTPGTIIDVRMGDVVNYMARREVEYEEKEKREWGVKERVEALFDGIKSFEMTEEQMDDITRKKMGQLIARG